MKISNDEIKWLKVHFPNLQYDEKCRKIIGELDFCAAYDDESRKVIIGNLTDETGFLIRDVYEVEICLGDLDMNGGQKYMKSAKGIVKSPKNATLISLICISIQRITLVV